LKDEKPFLVGEKGGAIVQAKKKGRPRKSDDYAESKSALKKQTPPANKKQRYEKLEVKSEKLSLSPNAPFRTGANQFGAYCPHCRNFTKKAIYEDHVSNCQNSSKANVPFQSLMNAIDTLQNDHKVDSNKAIQDRRKRSNKLDISENHDEYDKAVPGETAKKSHKKSKQPDKEKEAVRDEVDLREFYFDSRPKRKAHDVALESFKDIMAAEEKGKEEDYKIYKKFSKQSTDGKVVQNKMSEKKEETKQQFRSEETNSTDDDDDVAQLANTIMKNWDSKELMKEVFDIVPASNYKDEDKPLSESLKKKSNKKMTLPKKAEKSRCNLCNSKSCNDSIGIKNCLSCNYISYRKCDLERHIKEEHHKNKPASNILSRMQPQKLREKKQHLFNCNGCQYSTPHHSDMERHKEMEHGCQQYRNDMFQQGHKAPGQYFDQGNYMYAPQGGPSGLNIQIGFGSSPVMKENTLEDVRNDPTHSCQECDFKTYSEVALNTHVIIYH